MMWEIDDDECLLLEAFTQLPAEAKSVLIKQTCLAAFMEIFGPTETDRFYASYERGWLAAQPATPEKLATRFLTRLMPPLPGRDRFDAYGFELAYTDWAVPKLRNSALRYVFSSSALDGLHAAQLLDDLRECAQQVGPDFCLPAEATGDGFLDVEDTLSFIKDWRQAFEDALLSPNPRSKSR